MKRLILIIVTLSCVHSINEINAQKKINFGVQAGAGIASAFNYFPEKNEYTSDAELGIPKNFPVLSYHFSMYLSYPFNENYGLAIEPGIIQKGFANKFVQNYDLSHNKTYLSYIQVPILLEYNPVSPVTLTFGPEFGYLLNARMKVNDISEPISLMNYYKNNRLDVGIQAGGYYTFSDHLDVGIKSGTSFTNLEKFYLTNDEGSVLTEVRKKSVYLNAFARIKF